MVVPRHAGRDIRYPVEVRFKSLHDNYYQHKTETKIEVLIGKNDKDLNRNIMLI